MPEARGPGLTTRELAVEFGVCWRTIHRDLIALEQAGFPLVEDDARRWRVFDWRKEAA